MADYYRDDLVDFVRYGKLDAYDLTDEELAHLLEVWRWSVVNRRANPSDDVREAARQLQRHLAQRHNVEVEYNTALLLKQEIEPLVYLRTLLDLPKAIIYFLFHCPALIRALRQQRRLARIKPARGMHGGIMGYPRADLDQLNVRPPDVNRSRYWHQLSPYSFEDRKRLDFWW